MAFDFEVEQCTLAGVVIFSPVAFNDERGTIWTSFDETLRQMLNEVSPGLGGGFVHDKFVRSSQSVLRGIHGDEYTWKLVSCVAGTIQQVVVDCRPDSDTFGVYHSVVLDASQPRSVLVPPGFGNAFLVLSGEALYHYKLAYEGDYKDAGEQFTFAWDDHLFNIDWMTDSPILSERDRNANK